MQSIREASVSIEIHFNRVGRLIQTVSKLPYKS